MAFCEAYKFDSRLLGMEGEEDFDISLIENFGIQPAGFYRVSVYMNNIFFDNLDVNFYFSKNNKRLEPCLSGKDFYLFGVKREFVKVVQFSADSCVDLFSIPGASFKFDFNLLRLYVQVPQVFVNKERRSNLAHEKTWQKSISAFYSNYNLSGSEYVVKKGDAENVSSNFLSLQSGVNVGDWRLRNFSTGSYSDKSEARWRSNSTYLKRTLYSIASELTLGASNTQADIFDSISYRGVQLESDDYVADVNSSGFAPLITGIARTNAVVEVRQAGDLIYSEAVSPGAFSLEGINPLSRGGDIDVVIKESDGSSQAFVVPYSFLPVFLNPGLFKYSVVAGQLAEVSYSDKKMEFLQAEYKHGLTYGLTTYGGGQVSPEYSAYALGLGKTLGRFGAVSLDVTRADYKSLDGAALSGSYGRVRYHKFLGSSRTDFSLSIYKYNEGYRAMADAQKVNCSLEGCYTFDVLSARDYKIRSNISQPLGRWGRIYVSSNNEFYKRSRGNRAEYSLGYSQSWRNINFSLSATNYTSNYSSDRLFSFSVSMPLSLYNIPTYVSHSINDLGSGRVAQNTNISGSAFEQRLSWGAQNSHDQMGGDNRHLNLSYKGAYGQLAAGYGSSDSVDRYNYRAAGGVLIYDDGLIFSQTITRPSAIVSVSKVKDVKAGYSPGVVTDSRGNAIVSGLQPYRENKIFLDSTTFPEGLYVDKPLQSVVPVKESFIKVDFSAKFGYGLFVNLHKHDGSKVPFGAIVSTVDGLVSGIADEGAVVYLEGLPEAEVTLAVKWGKGSTCTAKLDVGRLAAAGVSSTEALCE
ncbi:fimbria/pilus outer membrane usher protein [Pseudomonas sp. RC4D1]|uniref:fimbria/pilus outer membrane usher protein n=1 Tax=Pseudomonas sp. RC4D1 TaxID=2834407 RepID=UPI0024BE75C1|nr:fimbria/pilus outer membrane usher protein [Pseudomonas sp. RC4D1]